MVFITGAKQGVSRGTSSLAACEVVAKTLHALLTISHDDLTECLAYLKQFRWSLCRIRFLFTAFFMLVAAGAESWAVSASCKHASR